MEIALIILGILALSGIAAAAWLTVERTRTIGTAARASAEAEGAKREAAQGREEAQRLAASLSNSGAELQRAATQAASAMQRAEGLADQLAESMKRSEIEKRSLLDRAAADQKESLARRDERWEKELARIEGIAEEKVASAVRERNASREEKAHFEITMRDAFATLSREAMEKNSVQFLTMAEQKLEAKRSAVDELVKPIAETLRNTDAKLAIIESAGTSLKEETSRLVRALRDPHVRGRYGEMQLRRVAELAGMSAYCDFCEQDQTRDGDGNAMRPDMIVNLPSERTIVVDAKTNIAAYMEALSARTPEEAEVCLARFARHVSEQATALSRKKYWAQYDGSPEFVVMFIPGDQFVDAALSRQTDLLDRAAEQGVILASPATLIGLLRAVAIGFQEQKLAKAAAELRELGRELHHRAATAFGYIADMGGSLEKAVEKYNAFVASYQQRFEPTLKKFEEVGVKGTKELPEMETVATRVKVLE